MTLETDFKNVGLDLEREIERKRPRKKKEKKGGERKR